MFNREEERLTMPEKPKEIKPQHPFVLFQCDCGEELTWPWKEGWTLNFCGLIQAQCPCGKIINTAKLLEEEQKDG